MFELNEILDAIINAGGCPMFVGGYVRDRILGNPSEDVDIEVFGLSMSQLINVLIKFGETSVDGNTFATARIKKLPFDFSLPRTDRKVGLGHTGFDIEIIPNASFEDAALRRDFTINSVMSDALTGEIADPFGGINDLQDGVLRMTSPDSFSDDPLRVLRGMQFCGRFDLFPDIPTADAMFNAKSEFRTISIERIWKEWEKWAALSERPSSGMRCLTVSGWVDLWPMLNDMIGLQQNPEHHPEGDAWEHTLQVVDIATTQAINNNLCREDRAILVFAALCHDMGKPATTALDEDGNIITHGHDLVGSTVAETFLEKIGAPAMVISRVCALVREHMASISFRGSISNKTVRRLANRLQPSNIEEWFMLVNADFRGRGDPECGNPPGASKILELAREMEIDLNAPRPILMGRHLINHMRPGVEMGNILRQAFEAQLDGEFFDVDGALDWSETKFGVGRG